jgi:ABC-type spermidine/putrescine transport system permease subunit II
LKKALTFSNAGHLIEIIISSFILGIYISFHKFICSKILEASKNKTLTNHRLVAIYTPNVAIISPQVSKIVIFLIQKQPSHYYRNWWDKKK